MIRSLFSKSLGATGPSLDRPEPHIFMKVVRPPAAY
jgi:hypothetical protein